MSDFGYQRPPITLFDQKLTLDPEIAATIAQIDAERAARDWLARMQSPNWMLHIPLFDRMAAGMFPPRAMPLPRVPLPTAPVVPGRALGPKPPAPTPAATRVPSQATLFAPSDPFAVPKGGEVSDVLGAVYRLPVVQSLVLRMNDEFDRQWRTFKLEFKAAPTSENVGVIAMSAMVLSGMLTPVIANKAPREAALRLLKGTEIPVPFVPWLSVKIFNSREELEPKAPPQGMMTNPNARAANKDALPDGVMLMFDVAELFKVRAKK